MEGRERMGIFIWRERRGDFYMEGKWETRFFCNGGKRREIFFLIWRKRRDLFGWREKREGEFSLRGKR